MGFSLYTIPSIIGLAVNVFFGIYVWRKNPKGILNRMYFFVCLSFAVWALGDLLQIMSRNPVMGRLANDVLNVGISFLTSIFLHFGLVFSEKKKLLAKKITYLWLYGPAILFVLLTRFTDFVNPRQPIETYYGYTSTAAPGQAVFLSWAAVFGLITAYLCFKVYWKTEEPRKKRAAFLFFIGSLLTFLIGFIGDGVVSMFRISFFSSIIVFSSMLFDIIIAYAIVKYGFMSITPQLAAETVVTAMPDFLVVLDANFNIAFTNVNALNVLGYQKNDLKDLPFEAIISAEPGVLQGLKEKMLKEPILDYEANYLAKAQEKISVSLNSYLLKDKAGQTFGVVTISRDMRQIKRFIRQIEESKKDMEIKNTELEKTKADLELKNSELKEKYQEIERFNKLMVGRELKMTELKKELEECRKKVGG